MYGHPLANARKPWWKSLTIWFNTVVASAPVLVDLSLTQLPALREFLPANIYGAAFAILTVGNILIRVFFTKSALSAK